MRRFIKRHQPPSRHAFSLKAGLGALIGIGIIAWLGEMVEAPLLIAPFGASCVLLFALPDSPLSQPVNLVGGHVLATALALGVDSALPDVWWATALAVALAISLMAALRLLHPPAGADPLVVMATHPDPTFLIFPVLAGTLALLSVALILHRLPPRIAYPLPVDD